MDPEKPSPIGKGRGVKTSQRQEQFEQARQSHIATWVQEARENVDVSSNVDLDMTPPAVPNVRRHQPNPIPQTLTQSPSALIASSGILGTRPTLPRGYRGRGRARGILPNSDSDDSVLGSGVGSRPESVVSLADPPPRRDFEDVLPSIPEPNESFITQFRKMGPSKSAGRGIFRGIPRVSPGEETIVVVPKEESPVTTSTSSSPTGILQSTPTMTETSSTDSSSDIGTDDYSHLEKAAIVMRGTRGTVLPIVANYIRLKVDKNKGYFEYHVDFEPAIDSIRFKKKIIFNHQDVLGKTRNFDGSKLYLPIKLEQNRTVLHSRHPTNPEQEVTVKIKYVKTNTFGSSVHFYNILFRRIMNILGLVEMGRNHYDYTQTYALPAHRLEIWPGYVTAIDEYEDGLMLTCDVSFRVLRTHTMLDVLEEIRSSTPGDRHKEIFRDTVLNKIVLTRHNNKSYRVDDVEWDQTPMNSFNRGGDMVTFVDYYKNHHKITIRDRTQPLLVSRPKPRRDDSYRKGDQPLICLIPELSYVTGLSDDITKSYSTMKDVTSFTRISPQTRIMKLETFIKNVRENAEASDLLNQWGLEIEQTPINLQARVMNAPIIQLNKSYSLKPAPTDFGREVMSKPIMMPIPVKRWLVFCCPHDIEKANRFITLYRQVTGPLGITVAVDARVQVIPGRGTKEDFRKTIAKNLHPELQFVVIILPNLRGDIYTSTKIQTLVDSPIPSQMILSQTLGKEKKMRAIATKIALQINCKLGGWLWSLQIPLTEKIMFVGMDVYHDPTNKSPSCLALITSMNAQHTKFFSRVIRHKSRQETADSIRAIFCESLAAFHDENHGFPDRVVVFRDGVGDGQLALTKEHEVTQFTSALEYVVGFIPKFTFVVVQKRINTRMFSFSEAGNLENPPPGTVLDHSVTRKFLFDYFLVSQYVRDGTVTPSHYIVLEDTSGISPDLAQKFAFASTFMYFNFPGTIRVPAVCQYAHKLAFLVGQHLKQSLPSELLANQLYFL